VQTDFDIHGLVGIRLLNPSPSDTAAVFRQLGPLQVSLGRDPDIIVRFVKSLPSPRLRHLDLNRNGFTDDGFFILQSSKKEAKVKISFDQVGKRCEIVCESGLRSVPLLTTLLNLTVLKKGHVPLHASAFVYRGVGVIVTGWAKGGKTEALLAFALQGAEYVGDEWVLLSGDGQNMYGIPENIRLWDWHLKYLPHVRRQLKREDRLLFKGVQRLDKMQQTISNGRLSRTFPLKILRDAMPALRRALNITIKPQAVFGGGFGKLAAKPEKVFLMVSHQDSNICVELTDPLVIARQMISSIRYEQLDFMKHYLAFKFAFPEMRNDFIENAHELQYDILRRALSGKDAYTVSHPYPVDLPALFQKMTPFCRATLSNPLVQV